MTSAWRGRAGCIAHDEKAGAPAHITRAEIEAHAAPADSSGMRNSLPIIALPSLALLLTACAGTSWDAPTRVQLGALSPAQSTAAERVFERHDVGANRISASPLTYELSGIASTRQLAAVKRDLDAIVARHGGEAPFEYAQLTYGVTGPHGPSRALLEFNVSPGSRAYIADQSARSPWREVTPTPSGRWKGYVHTHAYVAQSDGWVYIASIRDGFTRYARYDAETGERESVSYVTLTDAGLSEPRTARPASLAEGARWPGTSARTAQALPTRTVRQATEASASNTPAEFDQRD